jgi:hypothetical protein
MENLIVYRGTINNNDDEPYIGINKGYISTSKTLECIKNNSWRFLNELGGCCLYIYTIEPNVPYIDLSEISVYNKNHECDQQEILLPRGLLTTLNTITTTEINNKLYKTYHVTISLPNKPSYSIEDINSSLNTRKLKKIFDDICIIGDLYCFLTSLNNTVILDELDDKDFNSIKTKFINDLLIINYSNIDKYKTNMNEIVQGVINSQLLNNDQKIKLTELIEKINGIKI